SDAETRLNSLLTEAERRANTKDYGHEQKVALKADLDRVRSWWDSEFDRDGARGLALFASSLDNLWLTMPLAQSVSDEARLAGGATRGRPAVLRACPGPPRGGRDRPLARGGGAGRPRCGRLGGDARGRLGRTRGRPARPGRCEPRGVPVSAMRSGVDDGRR